MHHRKEDHARRRPGVHVAEQSAAGDVVADVFDRYMRVAYSWLIVKQQKQTGDNLNHEEKHGQPAGVIPPTHSVNGHFFLLDHRVKVELFDGKSFAYELRQAMGCFFQVDHALPSWSLLI